MIPVGLKLKMDGSEFQSGMNKAIGSLQQKIAGLFTLSKMIQFAQSVKSMVDTIKDTADSVGVSAEAFQELDYAFMQTGASAENFVMAMKTLSQVREAAIGGDDKAIEKLRQYGLSIRAVKESNPEEMFTMAARAVAAIPDPMSRAAAATDLFGKSAMKLIPAIMELDKLRLDSKGKILSNKEIDDLDRASDKIDILIKKTKVLGARAVLGGVGLFSGGVGETFQNMPQSQQNFNGMMQQTIRGLMSMFGDNIEGKSAAALKDTLDGIARRIEGANKGTYIGDVFRDEDAYFNSKEYLNALNKAQMPSSIAGGKTLLPDARGSIGLTSLQQIGAFAPTPNQQNQVLPILVKQEETQKQILASIRGIVGTMGVGL